MWCGDHIRAYCCDIRFMSNVFLATIFDLKMKCYAKKGTASASQFKETYHED